MSKPYVEHKGIKRTAVTAQTKSGTVTLIDYTTSKVQGKRCVKVQLGDKTGYVDLDTYPEIEAQIKAANEQYEQDFVVRYPGIYELVAAQDDAEYRYERLQRQIERGDGILSNSQPDRDPAEVAKQYPIAAAYLTICGYCDSRNLDKYNAGQWAVEQLENGADVIETCNVMRERWGARALDAVRRD